MTVKDLRSGIIPRRLENNDSSRDKKHIYDTTDLVYLDSYEEQFGGNLTNADRIVSATDHAKIHNIYINDRYKTEKGESSCLWWLRSASNSYGTYYVYYDGDWFTKYSSSRYLGVRPALLYNLPSKISARSAFGILKRQKIETKSDELEIDIKEVKNTQGKVIYHCLQLGERPKTKTDEELSKELENLYHSGKLREEIKATGRWYTDNGQKENDKDFAGVHSPEFEYKGNKYIREISYIAEDSTESSFSDGTKLGKSGTVRWLKLEKVSWIIRNWDEMPTSINPNGNGKAKWFDLISEEALIGNMPFYPNEDDQYSTMWQNSMPRGFLNGIDVRNITQNGSPKHSASRGGNFTGECNFLNETFNLEREPIYEYTIPESETEIVDDAFNGCVSLKKLHIHSGVTSIGKRAFEGIDFKYAYKLKSTGEWIFSDELIDSKDDLQENIELEKLVKNFVGFDYSIILQKDKSEKLYKLVETLNRNKFSIPYVYAKALIENGLEEEFCDNSDFRYFKSEFKDINDLLLDFPEEERLDFFKFAKILGCFSKERMLDKNGKETEVLLAQKSTSILSAFLKTNYMKLGEYHGLFDSMPFQTVTNQEFLKFISEEKVKKEKDEEGRTVKKEAKFENLELLMMLEKNYPGMFIKVMSNFEDVKSFRDCLDEYGKPIKISWEEALKKFYLSIKYVGITEENRDIAELFGGKGLSQEVFDKAVNLRKQAKLNNIPEHILGESIREENILESIEKIKSQTEQELISVKQMISDLYDKQFTYEWLSKNDPANSIMGLFCSCCGTITSSYYGKDIAKSSVIAEDIQNLVIRNNKGDIIAKGTFYLNKERGYGVINDFELNKSYRNHESGTAGIYNVKPDSKEEQEREMIFKAFQRGIQAFVEKYNEQNLRNPINQINVGTGYNRLKRQIERFKKATNNLTVPSEYNFQDARGGQYVLYESKGRNMEIRNGGRE